MGKLREFHKRLQQRIKSQEKDLLAIIKKNEQALLDLNRDQLMHGLRPDGSKLPAYKNESYKIMKELYNPLGVMDLRLTGKLHARMYIDTSRSPIVIWSDDEKTDKIVGNYGDIFGFTEASKKLIPKILEDDLNAYRKKLMEL